MYRELIRRTLNHFGYDVYQIGRSARQEVADPSIDPLTFDYMPQRRGFAVFDIRMRDVRGFFGLALMTREMHPFFWAMSRALDEDDEETRRQIVEATLADYYAAVRPCSALEVMDLEEADAPGLVGIPAFSFIMPWSPRDVDELTKARARSVRFEGIQNGRFSDIGHGLTAFGPVTPEKLALEVHRICTLLSSVRRRGFSPAFFEGPLKVTGLRRGDTYRWSTESGQHRFAMAGAVGLESVPARVVGIVRREDARYWPQVANGTFTAAGAEKVFDRIYDARPAKVCEAWIATQSALAEETLSEDTLAEIPKARAGARRRD
jgi:hypothetical protein